MKKNLLFLFLISFVFNLQAQLNMSLVGQLGYGNVDLNDIWGWADPETGVEYAIVGLRNGVSIVSLANPSNPEQVAFISGGNSTWRDIKTWDGYAYVTTDEPGTTDGLLVIDLNDLPNSAPFFNWNPQIAGGTLNTCHNIYIDENGYVYLAGCNVNSGGMVILDAFTTPGMPIHVSNAPSTYSHDVYVRGDTMYSSQIDDGNLGIYDVSDKDNIILMATQETPFEFTHNAWLNDAGTAVFTTDELANAPVASYDITDLDDIKELDQFLPLATAGLDVIPHNVHVWKDWLLISYYTDGGIVADASNPSNLIEVGNFDTFLGGNGGFSGAWGLYPFLPSGLILVSDINSGLYVLEPNLVRACWLEGFVRDSLTNDPIFNSRVEINSSQVNFAFSDLSGEYKTGQAIPGTFEVTFEALGYESKTYTVDLANGVLTNLDAELVRKPFFDLGGSVLKNNGTPVANATVLAMNDEVTFEATTDSNGDYNLIIPIENAGAFDVFAFAWGCLFEMEENVNINNNADIDFEMQPGYQDHFFFGFPWTVTDDATSGEWERGEPNGTNFGGNLSNPEFDVPDDFGDLAYITGNGGGQAGSDDVDDGTVTLISPITDLSNYNRPELTFDYWFFNAGGNPPLNDAFEVRVNNGTDEIILFNTTESQSAWRAIPPIDIASFIPLTAEMQFIFETADIASEVQHLVEAGVDDFLILETEAYPPFLVSNNVGCLPVSIEFTDQSDTTLTWSWEFEGGTPATSDLQNPIVTYDNAGVFDVKLTVTTQSGSTIIVDRSSFITINEEPTANFGFNLNGNTVEFTNTGNGANTYAWDFGDGNTSTEENPNYEYDMVGTYNVSLTVTNDCGSNTIEKIVMVDAVPPSASILTSQTTGCAPHEIEFTDMSAGVPTAWLWQFPGGTPETSTEQNVTVTYATAGTYSASLQVTNAAGTDTETISQTIVIETVPIANYEWNLVGGFFTPINLSQGATSFEWDFGDGTTSSDEAPSHNFTENGEYTITLTAINDCGQNSYSLAVFVDLTTSTNSIENTVNTSIFPNPFTNEFSFEYDLGKSMEGIQLTIYNILGQQIERMDLKAEKGIVNLGKNYQNGVYLLSIEREDAVLTKQKVVKQ